MKSENFRIAIQGILSNRLRSALTMLGILIGVGAVILLVAVGNGSSIAVQKNIQNLGTNTLIVFRGGNFGRGAGNRPGTQSRLINLTAADVTALRDKSQAPDIKAVAPVRTASPTGTYQGNTYAPGQFIGTTPEYQSIRNQPVSSGRWFDQTDLESHARVVLLGTTVVTNLFGDANANPIGASVQFNAGTYQVVGVLKSKGSNGAQDQDDLAIIPITAIEDSLTGSTASYSQIAVEATSRNTGDAASAEITSVLDTTHNITNPTGNEFRVLNQSALLATSSSTNRTFTVLLGAVAAISLLVGGIGVMNIMLVTVTERTREIGIRKAIGARKGDILGQFLGEAVLLSVLGGAVGVVAGVVGSNFKIVGVKPVIQPYSVVLAFAVALLVGLFFGIYPANRAASLRPIDALRYE